MRRIRLISVLVIILVLSIQIQMAQAQDLFEIAYGETQTRHFEAERLDHRWFMLNEDRFPVLEAEEGDMLRIRVFRIGGQFTPTITLLTGANEELAVSSENQFTDTAELIYEEGLPASNVGFQIEVSRPADSAYDTLNPPQYSLTLEVIGHRRDTADEVLPDIPEPPELEVGDSQSLPSAITAFGENVVSNQVSSGVALSSLGWEVTVNSQIAAGISSATFLDNGIGLTIRRDTNPVFFSDQNFTVAPFENENEYRFTITNFDGSQTQIISDFRRVKWIQARNGVISFAMLPTENNEKRLIFNNNYVDIRRISSGETEAAVFDIKLENNQFIQTDLLGWDQLAYYDNQLRVDYGRDARFLSDTAFYIIKQNSANLELNDIAWFGSGASGAPRLDFQIGWQGLAEVEIADNQVRVQNLLGEDTLKSLDELYRTSDLSLNAKALIIKQGAMLFTGGSGDNRTYLTVLPDGTRIETPSQLTTDSNLIPYQEGFRTRNYNNLGDNILPLCACIESIEAMIPVNPANGNFFYEINDFSFSGHHMSLELKRYYNSYDVGLTPDYMLDSPVAYPQMGVGWRHSYQYELDMSSALLGRIRFIEPDGTGHYFTPQEGVANTWRSQTLWSMVIIQEDGVLGSWRAETSDGLTYYFDPAGRLTRISSSSSQSITIVPALASSEQIDDSGIFIVEPYGRRIELKKGASGYIETASDSFERLIRYGYTGNQLTSVAYDINASSTAQYSYDNEFGFLSRYDDVRSPYVAVGTISYNEDGRVSNYVENPDGAIVPDYSYSYSRNDSGDLVTSRSILVDNSSEPRISTWVYNQRYQLTQLVLPHKDAEGNTDWSYEFSYDDSTGRLVRIRIPTLVSFTFSFDQRGNLISFQDPIHPVPYSFDYVQNGNRSFLTQIDYPSNRVDYFEWSDGDNPKLIEHRIRTLESARGDIYRTTRFVYDEWERLALLVKVNDPNTDDKSVNIGTAYQYDDFGYVSSIWEGIVLEDSDLDSPDILANVLANSSPLSQLNFSHDQFGQLRSFQNGNNTFVLNWVDEKLSEVRDSADTNFAIEYDYDERGRVIAVNDRGHITNYDYNGLDLVSEMKTTADGIAADQTDILKFSYDEAGNLLLIEDDLNRTTRFRYDSLDNLIQRITAGGASYAYQIEIDPRGLLLRREIDPIGRVIERQYDAVGRLDAYRIRSEGFEQNFEIDYNAASNPTKITGVLGDSGVVFSDMSITYNFVGDIRQISVNGAVTNFTYDDFGQLTSRTSPAGRRTAYQYDALGNILSVTLPEGGVWEYSYGVNSNLESVTDPNGLTTQYVYDKYNQLTNILDPRGEPQQIYSYDIHGNLTGITDARDNFRSFEYDNRNNLTTVINETDQRIRYGYDTVGRLTDLSQPVISFTYDNDDNIIGLTQIEATRTLFSYDGIGRITSISDPLGHTTTYRYNPVGRITQVIDSLGNEQTFGWQAGTNYLAQYTNAADQTFTINKDSLGRMTSVRSEAGGLNSYFSYDLDGYVTGITVASDNRFNDGIENNDLRYGYTYNDDGLPISYRNPLGGVWELHYDAGSRLSEVIQPNGAVRRYQYDDLSRIIAIEHYADANDAEAYATEVYEYNDNGSLETYISPNNTVNSYNYDRSNRMALAILAEETDVERTYLFDDRGRGILRVVDPLNRETNYYYQLGRYRRVEKTVPEIEDPFDYSYFNFDSAGNLTDVQLLSSPFTENGEMIEINQTYDALNRRVRYVNSDNKSWSYTYDPLGNLTQVSDPLGSVVAYTYNSDNRVVSIQYPSGNTVQLTYDGLGNLASVILPPNEANVSQEIFYELDPLGNITQIGNAGQILNDNGFRYDYDAMGNVIQRTMPNNVQTDYDYDAAGHLISTSYDNNVVIDYTYDAEGNLTEAGNDSFKSTYMYDALGQVVEATENGLQLNYSYDNVGNLISMNADDLTIARTYTYDAFDRLETIQLNDISLELKYNDLDQITDIIRIHGSDTENTINTTIRYDSAGRPITINHTDRNSRYVDGFGYTYDAVGNLIRIERGDGSVILYSYDVDHRLISERWLNFADETIHVVSFRYDSAGNRIEELRNGLRTVYTYNDQNRLIQEDRNLTSQRGTALLWPSLGLGAAAIFMVQRRRRRLWFLPALFVVASVAFAQTNAPQMTVTYAYDANGNVNRIAYQSTETFELTLSYDAENRLTTVSGKNEHGEDVNTQLKYDQFSRLVEWQDGDTVYTLYYDGDTLLGMSDGTTFQEFLYVDEQILLTQTGGESLWHFNDQLGSTRGYVNQDGQGVSQQFEFGSFGLRIFPYAEDETASSELLAPTPLFAGQLYDPSTGFYLTGLRAYDPKTGRFLQPDPIRQDPIGTLYTYARNRPLVFNDPSGLSAEPFVEPLDAAILKDELKPESIIPRPNLAQFPIPASVNRLQADESFRAFRLLEEIRYGTNTVIGQLSPLRNDFYLFDFNPMSDAMRQLSAGGLMDVMAIYETGDGWMPDPSPNPTVVLNPFDQIDAIQPTMAQAYLQPLYWSFGEPVLGDILPSVSVPQGFSGRNELETELTNTLQPISLMTALVPETAYLLDIDNFVDEPQLPQIGVELPTAPVEPPVLDDLDALRQQSYDFISRILPPDFHCDSCVRPLSFNP